MKTLGVVAGMGMFASIHFLERLFDLTPAVKEWEYFRVKTDFNVFIPSRTRAILHKESSPAPGIIETIKGLITSGVDVIAVPCNSAHYWYDEVYEHISKPWINLIETTSKAAIDRGVKRPLVLSAYVPFEKKLYDKYLPVVYLNKAEREKFYSLIEQLKKNKEKNILKKELLRIVEPYADKVDGIIIACTEPSMLFKKNETTLGSFEIVDSTNEYAKECVRICMEAE